MRGAALLALLCLAPVARAAEPAILPAEWEAYRAAFADGQGVIVLDRNDPFLQYLKNDR